MYFFLSQHSGIYSVFRGIRITWYNQKPWDDAQIHTDTHIAVWLAAFENGVFLWKQKGSFPIIRNILSGSHYARHLTFITLFNPHKTLWYALLLPHRWEITPRKLSPIKGSTKVVKKQTVNAVLLSPKPMFSPLNCIATPRKLLPLTRYLFSKNSVKQAFGMGTEH